MKQPVEVVLCGQRFTLRSDLPPEQVQRVADFANRQIERVAADSGRADSLAVVLLSLLNVAGELLQSREGRTGEDLRAQEVLQRILERLDREFPEDQSSGELPFRLE